MYGASARLGATSAPAMMFDKEMTKEMTKDMTTMTRLRAVLAMATLTAFAGCYNVTYVAKTRTPAAAMYEEDMKFFLFGVVGEHDIQTAQRCPSGLAKVHTKQTAVDVLLSIVTIGIYTPRTAQITCAQ